MKRKPMNKSKIEWCHHTWNPVWGCLNNCPYCYARGMARRFAGEVSINNFIHDQNHGENLYKFIKFRNQLELFKPTFIKTNFDKYAPGTGKRIFVNSMSDIKFWRWEWLEMVLNRIAETPQHTFIFLTKYPEVYKDAHQWPDNIWLGTTITSIKGLKNYQENFYSTGNKLHKTFISFEPITEDFENYNQDDFDFECWDWVIMGIETGNRAKRYIPQNYEVINKLAMSFNIYGIPVFIKNNIKEHFGFDCVLQEYPK